ncbi:hypothetical protein B0H63DRAFT_109085 [Podospora didyma]|uniref:Uncharacterized protein n=1 Tax=Podospora didyma TaxID=330526 RepID=A0AAE0NZ08_9PEZI|nr:hypothetical protein B0H63DRAFT_109085 [Podospora didyma]
MPQNVPSGDLLRVSVSHCPSTHVHPEVALCKHGRQEQLSRSSPRICSRTEHAASQKTGFNGPPLRVAANGRLSISNVLTGQPLCCSSTTTSPKPGGLGDDLKEHERVVRRPFDGHRLPALFRRESAIGQAHGIHSVATAFLTKLPELTQSSEGHSTTRRHSNAQRLPLLLVGTNTHGPTLAFHPSGSLGAVVLLPRRYRAGHPRSPDRSLLSSPAAPTAPSIVDMTVIPRVCPQSQFQFQSQYPPRLGGRVSSILAETGPSTLVSWSNAGESPCQLARRCRSATRSSFCCWSAHDANLLLCF